MHLHPGETPADEATVRALLAEQVPDAAGLPIRASERQGTVHHVFLVGDELIARLPRAGHWAAELGSEELVIDRVRDALPIEVPEVVHAGIPSEVYPHAWVLQRRLPGDPTEPTADPALADALADVVEALRGTDPDGLPPAGRLPLADLDDGTRDAIAATPELDPIAVTAAWDEALRAPVWSCRRTTMHADLLPGNLLVHDGRLAAVIDWGSAGAGDGAQDLIPAWTVLRGAARDRFRDRLDSGDAAWDRARGIALHQALVGIPYYRDRHPEFAALCLATAREVLAE